MRDAAYLLGVQRALADAGFPSWEAFQAKYAELTQQKVDIINKLSPEEFTAWQQRLTPESRALFQHDAGELQQAALEGFRKVPEPSLWQQVSSFWNSSAEGRAQAEAVLNAEAARRNGTPRVDSYLVNLTPEGHFGVSRHGGARNILDLKQTEVMLPKEIPGVADAQHLLRWGGDGRWGAVPSYGLGGAALGAAVGAGLGAGTANDGEEAQNAGIGAGIGAGVGGLGGLGLGYLRGGVQGRGAAIAEHVIDTAKKVL